MASEADPKNPAWVEAATNHPDSGEGPGVPVEASVPSRSRLALTCLSGALEAAWRSVDDDLRDEIRRAAIRAGKDGLAHLRATAPVWLPRGSMLARLVLTAACESLDAMERKA